MKEEYYQLPADTLVDSVVKVHHLTIMQKLSEVKAGFRQLVKIYGSTYPEIHEVHALVFHCAWRLESHLAKETISVLPYVRRYSQDLRRQIGKRKPCMYSVCPSIHEMYLEHKLETRRFDLLLELVTEVKMPIKYNSLYQGTLKRLYDLRNLWEEQSRLENDVLFPKIVEMEAMLNAINYT